jgi:hypothetical protein
MRPVFLTLRFAAAKAEQYSGRVGIHGSRRGPVQCNQKFSFSASCRIRGLFADVICPVPGDPR